MRPLSKARRGKIPVGATLVVALFVYRNTAEFSGETQNSAGNAEFSGAFTTGCYTTSASSHNASTTQNTVAPIGKR